MKQKTKSLKNILRSLMGIFVIIALLNSSAIAVYASVDTLSQAKSIIRKYYVDEIPDSKLNSAKNMDELINLLNDPYTQFSQLKDLKTLQTA